MRRQERRRENHQTYRSPKHSHQQSSTSRVEALGSESFRHVGCPLIETGAIIPDRGNARSHLFACRPGRLSVSSGTAAGGLCRRLQPRADRGITGPEFRSKTDLLACLLLAPSTATQGRL